MVLKDNIAGRFVSLRTAEEDDAEFILKIRLDPSLNRFMHKTDPSLEKQKAWIRGKRLAKDDYHMIIEGPDSERFGTVAIYNIDRKKKTFEWGRWIISKDAPVLAALETARLVYNFAFNTLGLNEAAFGINRKNDSVVGFHKESGAEVVKTNSRGVYFKFRKRNLAKIENMYKRYVDEKNL